jgi:hypothetical protein
LGQLGFFDRLAPDLVFRVIGGMRLTHRACGIFVHQYLTLLGVSNKEFFSSVTRFYCHSNVA